MSKNIVLDSKVFFGQNQAQPDPPLCSSMKFHNFLDTFYKDFIISHPEILSGYSHAEPVTRIGFGA